MAEMKATIAADGGEAELKATLAAEGTLQARLTAGEMILNDYRLIIEDIEGGHRLTATRGSEVQSIDIMDGVDGFTPTISIASGVQPDVSGGAIVFHKITITDVNGTKEIMLRDGKDGADGTSSRVTVSQDPDGVLIQSSVIKPDGSMTSTMAVVKNGKTPVKGVDYFTEEEVQEIIDKASAGDGTGSGGGAVTSVNGQVGAVELGAGDVNAHEAEKASQNGNPVYIMPIAGTALGIVSTIAPESGKNLLPTVGNMDYNGISYIRNSDGSVTMRGTAAGRSIYNMYDPTIPLKLQSGKYVFSVGAELPEGVSLYLEAYTSMNTWEGWQFTKKIDTANPYIVFDTADEYELMIYAEVAAGTDVDLTIYPQIEAGNTPTGYEPYRLSGTISGIQLTISDAEETLSYAVDFGEEVERGRFDWNSGILTYINQSGISTEKACKAFDIAALEGLNTIFADAGIVSVNYYAKDEMRPAVEKRNQIPVLWLYGDSAGENKDTAVALEWQYGNQKGSCTRKWQGSSSIAFDKKNYTIKFDEAIDVGFGLQKKYCLKANFIDHSHARNLVSAKLWGQIVKSRASVPVELADLPNGGAVDGFPVVVMMNDEFHGLYTWNIPKDAWMFGMVSSKNLLPVYDLWLGSAYGVSYVRNADGSIHVSGTAQSNSTVYLVSPDMRWHLPGGNYTLSMGGEMPDGMHIIFEYYSEDGEGWLGKYGTINANNASVTARIEETQSEVIYIRVDQGSSVDITLYPQLEPGSEATAYEKYNPNKQAIVCAEVDAWFHQPPTFNSDVLEGQNYEIEHVSDGDESWVKESLTRLINACLNSDGSDIDTVIAQYADIDSAIDYMIFTSLICGNDMVARNYLLATFDGVKWYFSAYDMDSTFGMRSDGSSIHGTNDYSIWQEFSGHVLMRLIKENKIDAIRARYADIISSVMSEDNVNKQFWEFTSKIPKEMFGFDAQKWPTIPCTESSNAPQILSFYRLEKKQISSEVLGYSVDGEELPTASAEIKGGVKISDWFTVDNDTLMINQDKLAAAVIGALPVYEGEVADA